jgi:penicillin amidase
MRKIAQFFVFLIFITMIILLSIPIGSLPVLGMLLNPYTGFTQNARYSQLASQQKINFTELKEDAEVQYDSSFIPHIFAKNDHDLYYLQGYVEASDRLWQMDMQARTGMGELSEVVGEKTLENDRLMRRIALRYTAEELVKQFEKDGSIEMVNAFCDGVNSYIAQLDQKQLPLEYKLMNFSPRKHKPIYVAVLMKIMAMRLTAMEDDIQNTNFVNQFGKDFFDQMYPNFYESQSPIVPVGTKFNFKNHNSKNDFDAKEISKIAYQNAPLKHLDKNLGSNNWVVGPKKSKNGYPILCNDPHLKIHLPSVWYEMHLVSNDQNVYGVTMPGAPGIVIGFNNDVAWGVTNAGRDVRNWYHITFKDHQRNSIWVDQKEEKTIKKIEHIYVKNKGFVNDTVVYTSFGPIVYDASFAVNKDRSNLALSWTNYINSNELLTFAKLNKAKNLQDYLEALKTFHCPGQNFIFACKSGDIAIKQQGLFPNTPIDKDKFVLNGNTSQNKLNSFIPMDQNPTSINPERGFLSSANQHPTDQTYPYYYSSGDFEAYRNRRINDLLGSKAAFNVEDMKKMQGDNFGLMASEFLPFLLSNISKENQTKYHNELNMLRQWDYFYHASSIAPVLFELWFKKLNEITWDEFQDKKLQFEEPKAVVFLQLLKKNNDFKFWDIQKTAAIENNVDIINLSFVEAVKIYQKECFVDHKPMPWCDYKDTELPHLSQIAALGRFHLKTGGNKHIVNATWKDWAPSWRMIVELKPNRTEAFVNYPGGQSGNPGSPFYDNFVDNWCQNGYRKVLYSFKPSEVKSMHAIYFKPKK